MSDKTNKKPYDILPDLIYTYVNHYHWGETEEHKRAGLILLAWQLNVDIDKCEEALNHNIWCGDLCCLDSELLGFLSDVQKLPKKNPQRSKMEYVDRAVKDLKWRCVDNIKAVHNFYRESEALKNNEE